VASVAWEAAGKAVAAAARAMMERMNCMLVVGWESWSLLFREYVGAFGSLNEELVDWMMREEHGIVSCDALTYTLASASSSY
jgi:hypothetical protein